MTGPLGHHLGSSAVPLHTAYDAGLLDLDGVLYLGEEPVEHAAAGVRAAREAGMRVAFVTNNASRRPEDVAARLTALDIPAKASEVVTSGQAAVRVVASRVPPGAAVLVLGTAALVEQVREAGLVPVRRLAEAPDGAVAALVQGLSPQTSQEDLAEACVAVRAGALWVAGNRDATLPSPRGPLPGNGAFVDVLRRVTGSEPLVAGKPDPALHRESVERVAARRPLVVGDRLDTDVLGAVEGGSDSLLVLTGVETPTSLLAAPRGSRPTYVATDLRGLGEPHPQVHLEQDVARCRAATATYAHGALAVEGSGDDALRAAVVLAWACADAGRPVRG